MQQCWFSHRHKRREGAAERGLLAETSLIPDITQKTHHYNLKGRMQPAEGAPSWMFLTKIRKVTRLFPPSIWKTSPWCLCWNIQESKKYPRNSGNVGLRCGAWCIYILTASFCFVFCFFMFSQSFSFRQGLIFDTAAQPELALWLVFDRHFLKSRI